MAIIDLDESRQEIIIETRWVEAPSVRQIPGVRWDTNARVWYAPLSWATCCIARGVFRDGLEISERLNKWALLELAQRITPALSLRTLLDRAYDAEFGEVDRRLFGFQRIGADWLLTARDCLLSDEQGTGKTIQVLAALGRAAKSGDTPYPALIICPNSVKRNWRTEAQIWCQDANVFIITGTATARAKILKEAMNAPNAVIIINFESAQLHSRLAPYGSTRLARCRECDKAGDINLTATRCEVHPKDLNKIAFRTVIVDEAHRIKNPRSKQTRAVWALGHQSSVTRHIALTGTPIANAPDDLWSIMHFVSKNEYRSKSKWMDRYGLMAWNNYGGLDVVGLNPMMKDEFYKIFDPRHRRMLKSIVAPQLPPKIRQRRFVKMTPKQLKAYRDIETQLFTELEDGELLTTPSNLAKATRLLQFSSAYATIELETGDVRLAEPSPKLDELDDILEDLGDDHSVAIAAMHRQLIMLASARLTKRNVPHSLIVGGMADWQRDLALHDFQAGNTKRLLFTMAAGGTGLTMTAADTLICLQRDWSIVNNLQTEDRVHRIGSEIHDRINIIDIVTEDSIEDKRQIPRLYEKLERLEEINRDRTQLKANGIAAAHDPELEARLFSIMTGTL